mgnify:CR=1 FL=1
MKRDNNNRKDHSQVDEDNSYREGKIDLKITSESRLESISCSEMTIDAKAKKSTNLSSSLLSSSEIIRNGMVTSQISVHA